MCPCAALRCRVCSWGLQGLNGRTCGQAARAVYANDSTACQTPEQQRGGRGWLWLVPASQLAGRWDQIWTLESGLQSRCALHFTGELLIWQKGLELQWENNVLKGAEPLVGAKGRPPQNVPLRKVDYFELKATETLLVQERLFPSLNYLKKSKLGSFLKLRLQVISFVWMVRLYSRANKYQPLTAL